MVILSTITVQWLTCATLLCVCCVGDCHSSGQGQGWTDDALWLWLWRPPLKQDSSAAEILNPSSQWTLRGLIAPTTLLPTGTTPPPHHLCEWRPSGSQYSLTVSSGFFFGVFITPTNILLFGVLQNLRCTAFWICKLFISTALYVFLLRLYACWLWFCSRLFCFYLWMFILTAFL